MGDVPNEVNRSMYPLMPTCSSKKLSRFSRNGLNFSSRIPILLRVERYSKLAELPWSIRTFFTMKLGAMIETTMGSSRFWLIPSNSLPVNEIIGCRAILSSFLTLFTNIIAQRCHFLIRARISPACKPPRNSVNDLAYLVVHGWSNILPIVRLWSPLRAAAPLLIRNALQGSSSVCSVGVLAEVSFPNQWFDLVI